MPAQSFSLDSNFRRSYSGLREFEDDARHSN